MSADLFDLAVLALRMTRELDEWTLGVADVPSPAERQALAGRLINAVQKYGHEVKVALLAEATNRNQRRQVKKVYASRFERFQDGLEKRLLDLVDSASDEVTAAEFRAWFGAYIQHLCASNGRELVYDGVNHQLVFKH